VFTGDRSGDFLFAALHRAGLANRPTSVARDDGLVLRDAYIVATIRCAPPGNRPRPVEIARCAHFLDNEIALLPHVRVVLALGAIAWFACLKHFARAGAPLARPLPAFAHGKKIEVSWATPLGGSRLLLGSYHVSQQNTQTRKLTAPMFDALLATATQCAIR
jgi:uracil-DNA glycosylase